MRRNDRVLAGGMRWLGLLGVISVAVFLPLAKGGNTDWARGIAVMIVVLFFALNWPGIAQRESREAAPVGPWLLVWGAVSLLICIQLLPGLGSISGLVLSDSCITEEICSRQTISPYPMATLSHWAMFSLYWMTAWLVSGLRLRQVRILLGIIALLALFEALYGMLAFVQGQETILGLWPKEHYLQDVTGTFVNRNHFSGFLEVSWPLALSLFLLPAEKGGYRWPNKLRYSLVGLFSLLVGLGILNSHSRLGTVSAIAGLVIWWLLVRDHNRQDDFHSPTPFGPLLAVLVLMGGIWFGLDALIERFIFLPESTGRFEIWGALLELPIANWLAGFGAGSYIDVFRLVQPAERQVLSEYAHSDFLEFFLDFGLVGGVLILGAGVYWAKKLFPRRLNLLQIGAFSGILAILLHSIGDFNLHIPGTAIIFWIAVGILMNRNFRIRVRRAVETHQ